MYFKTQAQLLCVGSCLLCVCQIKLEHEHGTLYIYSCYLIDFFVVDLFKDVAGRVEQRRRRDEMGETPFRLSSLTKELLQS